MRTLKVSATAHGLNYLPEYVARESGRFTENGIDVPYRVCNPWDGVMHHLADGSADVALGGLWVPAMYSGMGRNFVAFAQLNDRFPMCVVTREPVVDFRWSWLTGKTVLAPGQGGTAPAEFTRGLLREAGVDPWQTRYSHDLSMRMLRELFVGGLGDAFITDLVTATELRKAGQGVISCQHAKVGGRMPNSVYYVLRERLDELMSRLVPFVRSIDASMTALRGRTNDDLTAVLQKEWPEADVSILTEVTELLIDSGTWATVRIDRAACDRWTGILHSAGLTVAQPSYDSIVTTRVVDAVERQTV